MVWNIGGPFWSAEMVFRASCLGEGIRIGVLVVGESGNVIVRGNWGWALDLGYCLPE